MGRQLAHAGMIAKGSDIASQAKQRRPNAHPCKLRHTYTRHAGGLGTDTGATMDQLGHTNPGFTLRIYRHAMGRDPASQQGLRGLVGLADTWLSGQRKGRNLNIGPSEEVPAEASEQTKGPQRGSFS
jgi:hypothetical protein